MVPFRRRGGGSHGRSHDVDVGPLLLRAAAFLLALLTAGRADAASARFTRISVEQGLSQSSVENIAEDGFGFLWFGTQEGLNRFDGYRFTVYQGRASAGYLRDSFIRAIARDADGNLWIGTESGVQHLDVGTGRFSDSVAPEGVGVRLNTLRVGLGGRIWFGGLYGGLWTRGLRDTGAAVRTAADLIGSSDSVTAVNIDGDDTVWIASAGRLISVKKHSSGNDFNSAVVLADAGFIRVIHVADDGTLWLGRSDRPLLRLDPRSGAATEYPAVPRNILAISGAEEGRLWIGARDAGLMHFDPVSGETVTYVHEPGNQDSLAENDVASIHRDRGGNLWVGAWNGGLSRLNLFSQAFRTVRRDPANPGSLPDNDVTRLAVDAAGRLWTISRNDVLSAGDPERNAFSIIPLARDLTAIAAAGSRMFVGTANGLLEFDHTSLGVVPPGREVREAGLHLARIDAMHGSGDVLWAISGGRLHRVDASGREPTTSLELPSREEPASMFSASPEKLWIAWSEGLLLLVERSGEVLDSRRISGRTLTDRGRLIAIIESRDVIWIGAAGGLGRLGPDGAVEWLDIEKGMPSRSVASILTDELGMLWIAANRGITRFDPRTKRAVHFGAAQGTQGSGYVDSGVARDAAGRFYFAGKGITTFVPGEVVESPYRPHVLFTALEILHKPMLPRWMDPNSPLDTAIHAAREVELGPDAVVFSVEMSAPGATDPDSLVFAHRLEGFEDEWIETTADRRVATYTRLAPGDYTLRARAQNEYGSWSAEEATLRLRVLPPWWKTPLAIALWCLLGVVIVGAFLAEIRRRTRVRIALAEQGALRRASVTDPLTGLYNRRFLAEWIRLEIPRALREHRTRPDAMERLHVVIADLDHLKDINDRAGHDAGDRAIRSVAELLQSSARPEDVAVRLGGDEFVLILRSRHPSEVLDAVEALRREAEAICDSTEGVPPCSLSIGFASFPFIAADPSGLTWEQTMQLADRALLRSKRRGRNVWTGVMATEDSSAAMIIDALSKTDDTALAAVVRVVEGPPKP